jgi:hypothetical protein
MQLSPTAGSRRAAGRFPALSSPVRSGILTTRQQERSGGNPLAWRYLTPKAGLQVARPRTNVAAPSSGSSPHGRQHRTQEGASKGNYALRLQGNEKLP